MDSLIGKIIGPYRILRKIGRGGMSIVFLAEDERLGRKVAMKMIDQPHLEREKVLSEARHLSQLNHPGIITIYDVIEHQDGIFIIMEYVEGDSLENFLRTHRVDIQLAFHLAKHIVDTVKIAHEHNLIHGDLKPGNIIITPEGNIKLLDFGLSQLLDVPPPNKNVAGTFPFISPEQLTGSPPNEQSDIFALGMIIYQLSTGVVPFRKENQAAQIYAIMNEEPAPPTRINKSVPTALNNIVIRCLEKDPTKRYKSVKNIDADLKRAESSVIKKPSPSANKGFYWFIFFLITLFGIILFYQSQTKNRDLQVQSISEISLNQPVSLYFQYNPEENNSADAQSRILGLIEILSEQLNRVNGINIAEYNQLTGKAANQAELLPVNSVLINLSLQVNDNNSYNLEYQITNQKNHEKIQSKVHWIDFLDISWISNKILSQVLSVILGKRITLLAPNQELMDNARAYQFFSHGLYQYNEQNYSTAVKEFNEALKINPFFTQAHYYKGLSLFQIQEFKQAETAFFESLPEVKKNKFIEWQISISDSIDKPIYLMNALIDNRSSNYFFAYNPEFLDKLLLIDVEKKVKCYLNFPNTPVFLYHIHYDSGKFLFIIRNKNNPKLSIWGYDPKNKKWDYLIDIKNYYDIFLHYILIENDSTNILSWIDIQKADKVDTIYLKHKLYNRSKVYPTSDPNKFILENTNNIYLVDAHEKSAKYLNDLLPEFSRISKAVFGLKDYLIFPTSAEHFLNMYNITQNKIQFQFPLLYSEKFGLINNGSSSAFTIEESTNRILVKEPDSLLHLYQLTENGTIKSISSFNITNYDGNFQLTDNPFNKSPSSEILLCDKNTGEFLFANPKNNDIEIIHLNERILSTYFLSTNFLNISTQNRKVFMDVSKRKIAWEVDRTPDLSFYYLPERNTIFLYNYKEGKLLNFDLASMEISGSYNLFTTTQAYLTFVRSKLVYLEKNMVKVLNLNKMVDKNPINISGIYQKIAECEYQLGNHDKALEYVTRILKDFQPNRKSILLLQAKIIDHKYGYKKSISFLPLLYNTQPNGNLSRKMIENEFYRSGIYRWEQIVGIDRGYRILEATENKILCTGSISSIENKFWILRSIDGSILNNIPYKYCFNALLIPPDDLFYSESENYGGQLSYYLRKITDDQITKEYRQNQTTYFKPKLYQYGKNSIISFFAKTSNSPGFIQLINLKEKDVHEIYHSLDRKCEPLIKGNHLYFISGNTCFTVNLTNYELTSKYLDLLSTKPIHILGVIDIEPDQKTWLVNIKNVCYKLNINKSSLKLVEKISDYFQNIGYVSSKNVVRIFQDSANFSFQLPNDIKVEDMAISGNKVYVLQSDRLLVWKEGKIINTYPLLWSAIKFTIQNDTAYVLSSMGKIYAVNLNWTVDKLKKHLILSLN